MTNFSKTIMPAVCWLRQQRDQLLLQAWRQIHQIMTPDLTFLNIQVGIHSIYAVKGHSVSKNVINNHKFVSKKSFTYTFTPNLATQGSLVSFGCLGTGNGACMYIIYMQTKSRTRTADILQRAKKVTLPGHGTGGANG